MMAMDVPPSSPVAHVEVSESIQRYTIEGKSSSDLRRQMDALGPVDPLSGKRMSGYAKWNVRWSFQYVPDNGNCRISDYKVLLDAVITLPTWSREAEAKPKMRDGWNHFLDKLMLHEHGHRDIGLQAANAVAAALAGAESRPECHGYGNYLNELGRRAMRKFAQSDARYDAETRHGQTQGVTLP